MSNSYNEYYKKEDYFGKPYPGLVDFFKTHPERNVVLDLGCGQGRDALFLGRIGYKVIGADISDVGIQQLNKVAQKEKLQVKGLVADIYSFCITDEYDMVLLDSMSHFYKNDIEKEKKLFMKIIEEIKPGSSKGTPLSFTILFNCISLLLPFCMKLHTMVLVDVYYQETLKHYPIMPFEKAVGLYI